MVPFELKSCTIMKDELYSELLSQEQYFALWARKNPTILPDNIKDSMYRKYVEKFDAFNRDGFKCQNVHCTTPSSPLTLHHIKTQRNDGKDLAKNMVTVCDICHKRYERARGPLTFAKDAVHLHKRIRGRTFQLVKSIDIQTQWKKVKKLLKRFRKVLRKEGFKVSLKEYLDERDVDDDTRQLVMTVALNRK